MEFISHPEVHFLIIILSKNAAWGDVLEEIEEKLIEFIMIDSQQLQYDSFVMTLSRIDKVLSLKATGIKKVSGESEKRGERQEEEEEEEEE